MSRHGPGSRDIGFQLHGFQCRDRESDVAIGCPSKLGQLGSNRDSIVVIEKG